MMKPKSNPDPGFGWVWVDLAENAVIYPILSLSILSLSYLFYVFCRIFVSFFDFYCICFFLFVSSWVCCWVFAILCQVANFDLCQLPGLAKVSSYKSMLIQNIGSIIQNDCKWKIWDDTIWRNFFIFENTMLCDVFVDFWLSKRTGNGFSLNSIMENHWHLIKNV